MNLVILPVVLLFVSSILAAPTTILSPSPTSHEYQDRFRGKTAQRNMIIALSTIGGSIVLGFFIAIVRCTCRYKHPPKRDRIAESIDRYNLQCEMEELARNPYALRPRPLPLPEPAPPYVPPPPSYAQAHPFTESLHREGNPSTTRTDIS